MTGKWERLKKADFIVDKQYVHCLCKHFYHPDNVIKDTIFEIKHPYNT